MPIHVRHEFAMQRVAKQDETKVDLERPEGLASLVEIVTILKADFNIRYYERSNDSTNPMLAGLAKSDTSSRDYEMYWHKSSQSAV